MKKNVLAQGTAQVKDLWWEGTHSVWVAVRPVWLDCRESTCERQTGMACWGQTIEPAKNIPAVESGLRVQRGVGRPVLSSQKRLVPWWKWKRWSGVSGFKRHLGEKAQESVTDWVEGQEFCEILL